MVFVVLTFLVEITAVGILANPCMYIVVRG
jgi:hypothetical protein